jgi:hypothetical protein
MGREARREASGGGEESREHREPQRASRRFALLLIVMAFMLSLMGQDCTISCNNPPPASCLGCGPGEVVVCDSFCSTPRQRGQSCTVATADSFCSSDEAVCDTGLVCVPSPNPDSIVGTCQPQRLGQPCSDVNPLTSCGTPQICRACPAGTSTPPRCALPTQAGQPCVPGDICTQCAQGLECYAPTDSTGLFGLPDPGTCVLALSTDTGNCTTNAECNACAGSTCIAVQQDVAQPYGIAVGLTTILSGNDGPVPRDGECRTCAQGLHAACSQQTPCCTIGQECDFATDGQGIGNCCAALGTPCPGGLADCCPGTPFCRPTAAGVAPSCATCGSVGQFCQKGSQCCLGDRKCLGGTCECGAPGLSCGTSADCCEGNICVNKFCEKCPQYGNKCATNGDCCEGFECDVTPPSKAKACCAKQDTTCTQDSDCCSGLGCDPNTGKCTASCTSLPGFPCPSCCTPLKCEGKPSGECCYPDGVSCGSPDCCPGATDSPIPCCSGGARCKGGICGAGP